MSDRDRASADGSSTFTHVLILLVVGLTMESAYLGTNLNVIDEGWPLYAAMQLHAGGTLYQDVFFVFPPGHVLMAWIAYGIDPPGVFLARILFAAFNLSASLAIYLLGRRVMPAPYALGGALLLAVAADTAHRQQLLFGYRYLVFALLALVLFARHLQRRDARLLFAAGCLCGLALCFRLTPAFAAACAVGVGLLAASGDPRTWLRDGAVFAAGLLAVALPALGWLLLDTSAETLWREIVVRPVYMTERQSLPVPDWRWLPPDWTRREIDRWFVSVQFRTWTLLYVAYAASVVALWVRDLRAGRSFRDPLLATIVTFGGVFYMRSFGRSDGPHLYSALPPICLLLAHATWLALRAESPLGARLAQRGRRVTAALALAAWIFLMGSDRIFQGGHLGTQPLASLGGRIKVKPESGLQRVDFHVQRILRLTGPDDTVLDLAAAPMFHVLSGRPGPGLADVVMPGTFLDEAEERAFVARLDARPPAVVIFPGWRFDDREDRAVQQTAPLVWSWVSERYERLGRYERFVLMVPRGTAERLREGDTPG